jgi:hypothetical protein
MLCHIEVYVCIGFGVPFLLVLGSPVWNVCARWCLWNVSASWWKHGRAWKSVEVWRRPQRKQELALQFALERVRAGLFRVSSPKRFNTCAF